MRVALGFNTDLPVNETTKYVSLAEEENFDSFWLHEHSFGRDAISFLSAAAQQTKRIKLGVACLSPYIRHPVLLAMTAATLQESSHGREILGLGTAFPMRLDLLGIEHDKPITALKETIEICRGVWSGDTLNYSGKIFSVKNVKSLIGKPERQIPIYIAGWKKYMLMLTGRYADGYVAKGGESTKSIANIVKTIDSYARRYGRSLAQIEVGAYLLTLVSKSKDEAIQRASRDPFVVYMLSVQDDYLYEGTGIDPAKKKPIAENYFKGKFEEACANVKEEMIEAFTLVGTAEQVAERVHGFRNAGLDLPILQPISTKPDDVKAALSAGSNIISESKQF